MQVCVAAAKFSVKDNNKNGYDVKNARELGALFQDKR